MLMGYGWLSDFPTLEQTPPIIIRQSLEEFLKEHNISQIRAWDNSISIVQQQASWVLSKEDRAQHFAVVMEYELPREGGRRPDVLVLENSVVTVIEFKNKDSLFISDIDQVAAYARDLKHYHAQSHNLLVVPILVLTQSTIKRQKINGVTVLSPHQLGKELVALCRLNSGSQINAEEWVKGEYAPLPGLVQAARLLFHRQPLPRIRRSESAKIPETLGFISQIAHHASQTKTRHLVLLTGVPGAGKTLIGLQFVHTTALDDLRVDVPGRRVGAPAVFLSGNGPLVDVLQDALSSTAFVQGMKKFIEYYAFKQPDTIPLEHIFVFDEAQRAWDANIVEEKHRVRASEPELLISIAERIPEWCLVLGLVGEGQEIHRGEEAGIAQWAHAVKNATQDKLVVHCPDHLGKFFKDLNVQYEIEPLLNLTTSLRSHLAGDVHKWVEGLLNQPTMILPELRALAEKIINAGYQLYVTTDLNVAKNYVRERYLGAGDKRFGLLASRYANNLASLGIDNKYHFERATRLKVSCWFNADSRDPDSCCSLSRPATEFECQGLELDFPILIWGDDFIFDERRWCSKMSSRSKVTDPHKIRTNAYRVLMTRGRDGICVYLPIELSRNLRATASLLRSAGMKDLQS